MSTLRNLLEQDAPKEVPRRKLDMSERCTLWETYCGKVYEGACFCCGKINITPFNFHAGHIVPYNGKETEVLSNYRPICSTCNLSMGRHNMLEYIKLRYPDQYKKVIDSSD